MTLGQRIAQKRKEMGLSQEGLGEQLGVSRQAIYKWESDASLPEIEKLITLSKIFSVSVGWLLGVEEEAPPVQPADGSGELNEAQLAMVQEIVDRYQQAQPKPQRSAWDKWSVRILFAMCGIMLALLVGTNGKIKDMEQQYAYMSNSIGEVSYSVDRQINSITSRVEDILKSQNNLTAEWSADLVSTDLSNNLATFYVRVVPRTYVEGMTALFQARSGEETVWVPVEPGEDHSFSGQITCPLTDDISLTAILVTGDKRETQWLDDFDGLYNATFPPLRLHDTFWWSDIDGTILPPNAGQSHVNEVEVWNDEQENPFLSWKPDPPASLRVGFFQDRKLVTWYNGQTRSTNWDGVPSEDYAWYRTQEIELEPGHTYQHAAVYTDQYGRQLVYSSPGLDVEIDADGNLTTAHEAVYVDEAAPATWEF